MQYKLRRKDFINIIKEVFDGDDRLCEVLDIDEFIKTYMNHIVKRLKGPDSIYKFTREKYQTSVRLYFYYSQEKNIFNILALAMIEKRLFDERSN